MGNYKFRLSDMMPNSWFYKLRDMGRIRNQNSKTHPTKKKLQHKTSLTSSSSAAAAKAEQQQLRTRQPHHHLSSSHQRKSYHITRDFIESPEHLYSDLAAARGGGINHYPEEPPRKSSSKKKRRSIKRNRVLSSRSSPRLVSSSVSAGCSCRATLESVWTKPDSTPEEYPNSPLDSSSEHESLLPEIGSDRGLTPETFDGMLSWSSASCRCRVDKHIIIDAESNELPFNSNFDELQDFDPIPVPKVDLPPIITKTNKFNAPINTDTKRRGTNESTKIRRSTAKFEERNAYGSLSVKVVKEDVLSSPPAREHNNRNTAISAAARKSSSNSPGLKLRTNSPRLASKRLQGRRSVSSSSSSSSRKSISESMAVVKSSQDPQRDFRDSMVEMIVQNNIITSKDLEDLLACYLSLNSDEYHDLIIKVFKQIWFDIIGVRVK